MNRVVTCLSAAVAFLVFGSIDKGDSRNISGLADRLEDLPCEDLPVSPGWHSEGACPDWKVMAVEMSGRRYPLRRNANGDGWSKAACAQVFRTVDGLCPLAWLENGKGRYCVAARCANVTWLPVYMLSPFLFCEETKLNFGALRLDSFAEKVLMREIQDLPWEAIR